MTAVENADEAQRYDPRDIQDKWQTHWAAVEPFRASDDPTDPRERFIIEIGDAAIELELVEAALDRDRGQRDDLQVGARMAL